MCAEWFQTLGICASVPKCLDHSIAVGPIQVRGHASARNALRGEVNWQQLFPYSSTTTVNATSLCTSLKYIIAISPSLSLITKVPQPIDSRSFGALYIVNKGEKNERGDCICLKIVKSAFCLLDFHRPFGRGQTPTVSRRKKMRQMYTRLHPTPRCGKDFHLCDPPSAASVAVLFESSVFFVFHYASFYFGFFPLVLRLQSFPVLLDVDNSLVRHVE